MYSVHSYAIEYIIKRPGGCYGMLDPLVGKTVRTKDLAPLLGLPSYTNSEEVERRMIEEGINFRMVERTFFGKLRHGGFFFNRSKSGKTQEESAT